MYVLIVGAFVLGLRPTTTMKQPSYAKYVDGLAGRNSIRVAAHSVGLTYIGSDTLVRYNVAMKVLHSDRLA